MNPLRQRLESYRKETGIAWEILEQDYALSWILAGIFFVAPLKESLIFKGGTALKKCFFGDYRFSQDLDFSVRDSLAPDGEFLNLLQEASQLASKKLKEQGTFLHFKCEKYQERLPHPENQEAFTVQAQFPWHKDRYNTRLMVEITLQESVLLEPKPRQILHGYEERIKFPEIYTYQIEEIIAEKIRAILQYAKKIHERNWGRSRARDYYDLWRIFSRYSDQLNIRILPDLIERKCKMKGVTFSSPEDLFSPSLMADLDKAWEQWLIPIVPQLPQKEWVLAELRNALSSFLG